MKTINIFMVLVIVVLAMVLSADSLIAQWQIKTISCDLKNKEKGLRCESCDKMQNGFQCAKCVLSENDLQEGVRDGVSIINAHKKYYIVIDFNKDGFVIDECPRCKGRNFVKIDYLTSDKTCGECNKKPTREIEFCVKSEYYCPMHTDFKTLKPGVCTQTISAAFGAAFGEPRPAGREHRPAGREEKDKTKKCGKQLNERKIYASISYAYECPKCHPQGDPVGHQQDDNSGKCDACGQNKAKKAVCKNSGTFPHVNQVEWEKNTKVGQEPSVPKAFGTKEVIVKAYLPLSSDCHQKTVVLLNGFVKEYKGQVFVEYIDFSTKEGNERAQKDLGKVCAVLMINGKKTYTIKDENGEEREVTFSGPIDNQYTADDIRAVVKLLLGK
ncbi:MAG: hypothetical protein QME51_07905 [Planctomycetota bacterium]|nr:hypothetical protein [Planctomycetota bacterium]MDI6788280.1 hypothetical protein [Planctomycetota bacterium]